MNYALKLRPLEHIVWSKSNAVNTFLLTLAGLIALIITSKMTIPFTPVPLTLQSATVILIGMAYGPRHGAYVIGTYLLAGACGLPVFADATMGITKFLSPTGGYVLGFLPAVLISGYLAKIGFAKNILTSFIAACLSDSVIFLLGVTVLAQFVGWHNAMTLGFMPFVLSEGIKLFFVSLLVPKLWKTR